MYETIPVIIRSKAFILKPFYCRLTRRRKIKQYKIHIMSDLWERELKYDEITVKLQDDQIQTVERKLKTYHLVG